MTPIQLPNILIYLTGIIRPKLLRPNLKVTSIAQINFKSLKNQGYNAIVIDKDNCLTLPNKDEIYPPYQIAWNNLLNTFNPERVLIVSNSAGTKKDPGGIAAESVSLSLKAPILIHGQNKPGCSKDIISYFKGNLGKPITIRKKLIKENEKVIKEEKEDEEMLRLRWEDEIYKKPLLGYNHPSDSKLNERKGNIVTIEKQLKNSTISNKSNEIENNNNNNNNKEEEEELKLIVIGDRLFTDILLSHRLSLYLNKSKNIKTKNSLPSVLSIYTTSLPKYNDVRLLRWIEEKLSKSKIKGNFNFNQFKLKDKNEESINLNFIENKKQNKFIEFFKWFKISKWKEFYNSLPPLNLKNPKSWKPLPILFGLIKNLNYLISLIFKFIIVKSLNFGYNKFQFFFNKKFQNKSKIKFQE
ncbi:uncharacterized protein I206_100262 [Kwoniella pini CBS 10737]|uniref:HAD phosphatase, family IIIA n=1 Tax=Kwoniella pini CBS 10737 TaxID=1296096 RepID=A0A1B9IDX8_9TREE|nr:uncharacterized protein I206_01063 [Kwoniella pini CBS 10737]OCF53756.1 hypothetical protein I206_01063 [Kwoniella pini CBS 10737]